MSESADEIAITGLGIVSPVGGDARTSLKSILRGESGVQLLSESEQGKSPVRLHAPVDDAGLTRLERRERRRLDRSVQLALQAAREAWEDAARPAVEPVRLASIVATGVGGLLTIFAGHSHYMSKGQVGMPAFIVPALMSNAGAAVIAAEFGAHAGSLSLGSACASGSDAIAYALRLFQQDEIDVAIVGGSEAVIHPVTLTGFAALRALSTRHDDPSGASRPFDRDRDGFVLGEGAGVLILERRRHAVARGAHIWGKVLGTGATCDAGHIVAPEPTGKWNAEAMLRALRAACLKPSDITFVSAHATGTSNGDLAESRALAETFGEALPDVRVTALKSCIGHLIGASGAVSSALAVAALHEGFVPPTRNLENLDPEIDLNIVRGSAERIKDGPASALINSAGFGGHNVAIVVTRE